MEVLLNELSLDGQFDSSESFFETLKEVIRVQSTMNMCSITLLKHQELFNYKVTNNQTLHDVLIDNRSRTNSEARKFKLFLKQLMSDPPFWQEDQKHKDVDRYVCDYTSEVNGYSLAEACERNKLVLSFENERFKEGFLEIKKNGQSITLVNINDSRNFADYLLEMESISYQEYCRNRFEGLNLSFSALETGYDLNNLEEEEAKAFVSTFKNFSTMTWNEIHQSPGLDYKQYQPASRKFDWFVNSQYKDKQIYKFRASQKYRCFGYREGDIFFVLRYEVDHAASDNG